MSSLTSSQLAVLRDARRLLAEQTALAEQAPHTAALATVAPTPFGTGYVLGVVDALCQIHSVPFDPLAFAIFGILLDESCGRDASTERNAALEALVAPKNDERYGFDGGYQYGGNEALGWSRGECVPSALVLMAREK